MSTTGDKRAVWRTRALISLALLAGVAAVYAPVARFGFLRWDDQMYVTENAHVLGGLTWQNVWWAFAEGYKPYWQPVTWLSHQLDITLFGMNAGWHHLVNVVIHGATTVLIFEFFRRATQSIRRSAFVAAIFAVHPLHVESVAWIAERKDVLSALLLGFTLLAYLGYVRSSAKSTRAFVTVCLVFALALMAKPMVVTLPVLLLLLDVWPLRRVKLGESAGWPAVLLEKVPLAIMAVVTAVVTIATQKAVGALADLGAISWSVRASNALTAYAAYLWAAIWPTRLAAFYPHDWNMPWYLPAAAAVLLAVITLGAVRVRRRHPAVLVGWLWYLISLLPVIGLIQAGEQARADRFMYSPLVGLLIMAAWGVPVLVRKYARVPMRRVGLAVALAAVMVLAVLARIQVMYWSDDVTLWQHTVSVTNRNYLGYDLLGLAYRDRGKWDEAQASYAMAHQFAPPTMTDFSALVDYNIGFALVKQGHLDEGIEKFQAALRQKPDLFEAENDLGAAFVMLGKPVDAIPHYMNAVRMKPNFAEALNGLGAAREMEGDHPQAEAEYRRAIAVDPSQAVAHANLAMVLIRQKRDREAISEFLAALAIDPQHSDWRFNAGVLMARRGRNSEAVEQFRAALEIDPSNELAREALNMLVPRF